MMVSFHDIYFDCDELEKISIELKKKIEALNSCYGEIKNKANILSGPNDIWEGKDQKNYYRGLSLITDDYDKNISRLTERYNFLRDIIERYREEEKLLGKTIDKNSDNLNM